MRSMLREFRRAPARIAASVLALALAVGAIGVMAIPAVSEATLHEAVDRDGLADIIVNTTPMSAALSREIDAIDGVAAAEGQALAAVRLADGRDSVLLGLDFENQTMDRLHLTAGRLPVAGDEVVATPDQGSLGSVVQIDGRPLEIVGHGGTLWWSDSNVVFAPLGTVTHHTGGVNRIVVTADDDGEAALRAIAGEMRELLAGEGVTFTTFPISLPDGSTPIDQDIEQVSGLIGLLGIFAGAVALVLLASTTNALIAERTREVAVMRALGGRPRQLRRRLRRIAFGITACALAIGLPLGVLMSNLIARMVLEEFVGITPGFAVDWTVVVGSAVGALAGARLVAARAARRVVGVPLAEALRDREGRPFGGRSFHRLLTRVPMGGLFGSLAVRSSVRRPARTIAVVVQIAAAVGAAFLVPSLATSVNAFNSATQAPWSWESVASAAGPGLPLDQAVLTGRDGVESGIHTEGDVAGWDVDVFGLTTGTDVFDPRLTGTSSTWLRPGARDVVLSAGFAERNGIEVGDEIILELASGANRYSVVGMSDDAARAAYIDRDVLAADLGAAGRANTIWMSAGAETPSVAGVALATTTREALAADDAAGRDAIVVIFGAIGVIVAGVASLAVLSSASVSLYERRHELAALQAVGAGRRRLRGLVVREMLPITASGVLVGLALGALGSRAIIASFEASNAVDIGVVDAVGAIPAIVTGTFAVLLLLALAIVRMSTRRPIAVTLRGAA